MYTVYNKVLRQQSTIDLWGRRIEMVEKPQKFLVLMGIKKIKIVVDECGILLYNGEDV